MATATLHPLVQWAQREKILYLTVAIDKVDECNVTGKNVHIKGTYGGEGTVYEANIELFADVDAEYERLPTQRHFELKLNKKEGKWWPRLLNQQAKVPWVKVDFNKWKDEEEDDDDGGMGGMSGDFDFNQYMNNAGGNNAAPNLDDFDDEDSDISDHDMPELEETTDPHPEGAKVENISKEDSVPEKADKEKADEEEGGQGDEAKKTEVTSS
ncbi:hypothetical protein AB6A40_002582 [Gnathostoma spinigerum]|uniref:CS domain-containing protein n=1 Tax=Gnathostoma spinigerum TaxID=75299 RepID=A0ABD6E747_9BILA